MYAFFITDLKLGRYKLALLEENEIKKKISGFTGWNFSNDQIGKEFQLKDFPVNT